MITLYNIYVQRTGQRKNKEKNIRERKRKPDSSRNVIIMNDYPCTGSCGCQNPADDFVCHNCKIGMCKVGMKK